MEEKTIREKLGLMVESKKFYTIQNKSLKILSWRIVGIEIYINCTDSKNNVVPIKSSIEDFKDIFTYEIVSTNKSPIASLRNDLISDINKIRSGELDSSKASAISSHVQAVINITKLELQYRKHLSDNSNDDFLGIIKEDKQIE